MRRRALVVVATALLVFAFATLRTLDRGEQQMRASDAAFHAGQLELSLRHARRAATLYVPGAEHVEDAYARLRAIALGAERAGERDLALAAWRACRAAAIESRHLWQTRRGDLEFATAQLERLMQAELAPPRAQSPRASGVWSLLLGASFLAVAVGVGAAIRFGVGREGRVVVARLGWSALVVVLGLAFLCLAIARA